MLFRSLPSDPISFHWNDRKVLCNFGTGCKQKVYACLRLPQSWVEGPHCLHTRPARNNLMDLTSLEIPRLECDLHNQGQPYHSCYKPSLADSGHEVWQKRPNPSKNLRARSEKVYSEPFYLPFSFQTSSRPVYVGAKTVVVLECSIDRMDGNIPPRHSSRDGRMNL